MKDLADQLFEKYGPRLTTEDLAEVLKCSDQTIRKDICKNKFPIHTFKAKKGRRAPRFADYRAVAEYINSSSGQVSQDQDGYTEPASASPSSR